MNEGISRQTPLHAWHMASGARMADFGGYHMPMWYSSVKKEHLSVLTQVGLFDTSHMAVILLAGSDAHNLLQKCFTQNLDHCIGKDKKPIFKGRCVYGAFLNPDGCVIDDSIVYQVEKEHYLAVVNAGMGPVVAGHLNENRVQEKVEIVDLTDVLGKIDIQGPLAARLLGRLLKKPDRVFDRLVYFSFKGYFDDRHPAAEKVRLKDGTPILLSRTGYTGEFGFEIFIAAGHLIPFWESVIAVFRELEGLPCGLAARDSLRAGAVLPLSHQDIGPWPFIHHPWSFALPYNHDRSGFTKSFIGDQALLNVRSPEYTYAFLGSDLRKVSIDDPAVVHDISGKHIGNVLTCVTETGIGLHEGKVCRIADPEAPVDFNPRGLSCGFVKVNRPLAPGERISLRDRRRIIEVVIVDDIRPQRTARRPIQQML